MHKIFSILIALSCAQFSFAGHHESAHMKKVAAIGYEISDDGEKTDLIAGDMSHIKIWVDYVEAHNQRDLDAIRKTNADDFEGCLLYTSPSPRDKRQSRMPSSA